MRILAELSVLMRYDEKSDSTISSASIGWHIYHSLKVINKISEDLINSNPEDYTPENNKIKEWVFSNKTIKRGVAQSPERVLPPKEITKTDMLNQLESAKKNLILLEGLDNNAHFFHHNMGVMNKQNTLQFIEIHTKHHLAIINDILGDERTKKDELL